MHFTTLALATLASGAMAADKDYLMWCRDGGSDARVCLAKSLSQSCFDCLHPLEMACPGAFGEPEFDNCLGHIPSDSWSKIKACMNNAATGCAEKRFDILHAFEVGVRDEVKIQNKQYVCNKDNQKGDADITMLSEVAFYDCDHYDGPIVSASSAPSTSKPANTGKPSSSVALTAATTTAAPTSAGRASSSVVPNNATKTACPGNCNKPTQSGIVTAGAPLQIGVSAALVLAGIVAAL